jgi:hypothetical protein
MYSSVGHVIFDDVLATLISHGLKHTTLLTVEDGKDFT